MGDDAVNTAHRLIRVSRGLAGATVQVGVIAGAAHSVVHVPSVTTVGTLDTVADQLEADAVELRACAEQLREAS
jgi:hypothetical protein